jgi:hypothetical protein
MVLHFIRSTKFYKAAFVRTLIEWSSKATASGNTTTLAMKTTSSPWLSVFGNKESLILHVVV